MVKWKIIAIIFIILFVIESIVFGYLWVIGTDYWDKRNTCAINICKEGETFAYDEVDEICYCYDRDGEISHQQYIG